MCVCMIIVENKAVWTYKVEDLSIHSIFDKHKISKQNTGQPLTEVLSADSSPSLVAASSVMKLFFRR